MSITTQRIADMSPQRPIPGPRGWTARLSALLSLCLLMIVLMAAPLWALSEQEIDEKTRLIADQLRCPTCQGLSVRDSEASLSRQIHDKVRRMVREGQSEEAIKAYFVSRYGEWILRAPKKEGLGLVLWLLPGLGLLLCGGLIGIRVYRNHRERVAAPPIPADSLTDEQRARISRDLQNFEEQD